jgi:replicative DNA helicase
MNGFTGIETEQALLGGCILDGKAPKIDPDHFYRDGHRVIARTLKRLAQDGKAIDSTTLYNALIESKEIEGIGGASYLADLMETVPSGRNIQAYETIVTKSHHERRFKAQTVQLSTLVETEKPSLLSRQIDDLRCSMNQICDAESKPDGLKQTLQKMIVDIGDEQRSGKLLGLPTGLVKYDQLTSGLCPSDLIIVAARPGMGKTSFAINTAVKLAKAGKTVQFFSLEMNKEQVLYRAIADMANVDLLNLRSGNLEKEEKGRSIRIAGDIMELPINIDDRPRLTELEICSSALNAKPSIVFIDYLGYVKCSRSSKTDRKDLEIGEMTAAFKGLAKTLNIPVVLMCQLNRQVESRPDKRPTMADLRDSGSIEQDADVIAFIYRDSKYNPSSLDVGIAEIIIEKQRNGPTGTAAVAYLDFCTSFRNLDIADEMAFWTRKRSPKKSKEPRKSNKRHGDD